MGKIYLITNQVNGKQYVGQTRLTLESRFKSHCRKDKIESMAIRAAINKYGKENFTIELLEETTDLDDRETYYIEKYDTYKNGYNNTIGGGSQNIAVTPEVKEKLSVAGKNRHRNPHTEETKEKMRISRLKYIEENQWISPTTGGHTEEAKQKMRGRRPEQSERQKGRKLSPETKEKIRQKQLAAWERKRTQTP